LTSRHNPRSIPSRSATWRRRAGSPTARTCCCSGRRASARHTLSIALGREAILAGYTVQFTCATTLVAGLAKAHTERRLDEKLLALSKPKLLIVDELGYLPLEPDAAHLFFQLVSRRYEAGAMLITSNRSVAEWGTVFADPVVATAILDRLLHHSHVLTIRGDSYRLRAKRKSGLIRPPAGDGAPVGSASLRSVTGGYEHQPRS
jgi:hypothetical protein